MNTTNPTLLNTIAYYESLLQRYARRIIKDAEVAANLVMGVLEDQYEIDKLAPSPRLRKTLRIYLLNRCHYLKQSQIFDRPLIKVPLRKHLILLSKINENKYHSVN